VLDNWRTFETGSIPRERFYAVVKAGCDRVRKKWNALRGPEIRRTVDFSSNLLNFVYYIRDSQFRIISAGDMNRAERRIYDEKEDSEVRE